MQPLCILLMVVPGDPLGTKVALPGGGSVWSVTEEDRRGVTAAAEGVGDFWKDSWSQGVDAGDACGCQLTPLLQGQKRGVARPLMPGRA